jgi:hypothetical protein
MATVAVLLTTDLSDLDMSVDTRNKHLLYLIQGLKRRASSRIHQVVVAEEMWSPWVFWINVLVNATATATDIIVIKTHVKPPLAAATAFLKYFIPIKATMEVLQQLPVLLVESRVSVPRHCLSIKDRIRYIHLCNALCTLTLGLTRNWLTNRVATSRCRGEQA